jgi:hypothetical protein
MATRRGRRAAAAGRRPRPPACCRGWRSAPAPAPEIAPPDGQAGRARCRRPDRHPPTRPRHRPPRTTAARDASGADEPGRRPRPEGPKALKTDRRRAAPARIAAATTAASTPRAQPAATQRPAARDERTRAATSGRGGGGGAKAGTGETNQRGGHAAPPSANSQSTADRTTSPWQAAGLHQQPSTTGSPAATWRARLHSSA